MGNPKDEQQCHEIKDDASEDQEEARKEDILDSKEKEAVLQLDDTKLRPNDDSNKKANGDQKIAGKNKCKSGLPVVEVQEEDHDNEHETHVVDVDKIYENESHDGHSSGSVCGTGYTSFRDLLLEPLLPTSASDNHLRHPSQVPEHYLDSVNGYNDDYFLYNTASDSVSVIVHNISPRRLKQCAWLLVLFNIVALILAIPVLTLLAIRAQEEEHNDPSIDEGQITLNTLFFSASLFVLLACSLTVLQVFGHLTHWYQPDLQKLVICILCMIPIYSLSSWICLRQYKWTAAVTFFRGLYEAFVLYSFYVYKVEILGGKDHMIQMLQHKDPSYGTHCRCKSRHLPSESENESQMQQTNATVKKRNCDKIINCLLPRQWEMGEDFYRHTRRGIMQYVGLKIVYTVGLVYIVLRGGVNSFRVWWLGRALKVLLFVVMNLSVGRALYCLVKMLHATKQDLQRPINYHPTWKFACVKGVIFFTFWQDVLLQLFNVLGWIPSWGPNVPSGQVAAALQNYIVCLELLLFSVAHHFSFPYREYRSLSSSSLSSFARLNQRPSNETSGESNKKKERRAHMTIKESNRTHSVSPSSSSQHHRDTSFVDPPSALFSFATYHDSYSPERSHQPLTTQPRIAPAVVHFEEGRIPPRSTNPFDDDDED